MKNPHGINSKNRPTYFVKNVIFLKMDENTLLDFFYFTVLGPYYFCAKLGPPLKNCI